MNTKNIKILITISFIVLACCDNSFALIIGPARMEARLPAGEVAGIDYYAQNDTEAPIHVTVEPENWAKGTYDYSKFPINKWIKVDSSEFDLKPKEIKKLRLTVRVPKDAKGELVAQIFFSSLPAGADPTTGIRSRLGAVLYIAIKNTEKPVLVVKGIKVSGVADNANKLKIEVSARNDGNVHIRPAAGVINIFDQKGRRVAQAALEVDSSTLPASESVYEALLDSPELRQGNYSVSCEIKYGKMYGREKTAKHKSSFAVDSSGKVITNEA